MPDDDGIRRLDIAEFRHLGFLQEINRRILHPCGLAIEVTVDDDGTEHLGGVWDYRDDPEGIVYGDGVIDREKTMTVAALAQSKAATRRREFGWMVQPA